MRVVNARGRNEIVDFVKSLVPCQINHELIRLGGPNDGGYLVPDQLDGIEACFSPGVAAQTEFERDCLKRGIAIHMADASVDDPHLDGQDVPTSFEKKFLGSSTQEEFIRLDDWVHSKCPGTSDLMLQMDIEGSEYEVLHSMSDSLLERMRIMVIEFHGLNDVWFGGGRFIMSSIRKIAASHRVVHVHPNNADPVYQWFNVQIPNSLEVTFMRKSSCSKVGGRAELPHHLDEPCLGGRPEIVLENPWVE